MSRMTVLVDGERHPVVVRLSAPPIKGHLEYTWCAWAPAIDLGCAFGATKSEAVKNLEISFADYFKMKAEFAALGVK